MNTMDKKTMTELEIIKQKNLQQDFCEKFQAEYLRGVDKHFGDKAPSVLNDAIESGYQSANHRIIANTLKHEYKLPITSEQMDKAFSDEVRRKYVGVHKRLIPSQDKPLDQAKNIFKGVMKKKGMDVSSVVSKGKGVFNHASSIGGAAASEEPTQVLSTILKTAIEGAIAFFSSGASTAVSAGVKMAGKAVQAGIDKAQQGSDPKLEHKPKNEPSPYNNSGFGGPSM